MTHIRHIFAISALFFGGCVSTIAVPEAAENDPAADTTLLQYIDSEQPSNEEAPPPPDEDEAPENPSEPEDPAPEDPDEEPYVPEPGSESCVQWQECGPHYGDSNSGYECVNNTCSCDPTGNTQTNCQQAGGYFISEECYCAMADSPPPSEPIENQSEYDGQECWYHWEDVPCDPDTWVDTSYYDQECYYDANNEYICDTVYVNDGYWEEGYCPPGWWEVWCY